VLDLEELEEKDLDEIRQTYCDMAKEAREGRSSARAPKRRS
jgi:hypothetical protein